MPSPTAPTPGTESAALQVLRDTLRNPGRFVERRTDEIQDLSTRSVDWTVRLQVRLPSDKTLGSSAHLVSLGVFPKKRLPDLVAMDGAGAELPLLRRVDRTRALTALLLQDVLDSISVAEDKERELAELAYGFVSAQPAVALPKFEAYSTLLRALAPSAESVEPHLAFAQHFVSRTHVLACVMPSATGYQNITFRYSERHALPDRPRVIGGVKGQRVRLLLRYWGMTLGLLPVPFDMRLSGANHAHSYYLLVLPPPGTEVEAIYWKRRQRRHPDSPAADQDPAYIHESKHEALACYHPEHDVHGGDSRVDLRLNGSALRPLWLLTALLVAIGVYLARTTTDLSNAMSLLAAIPAGLVAFATQSKHELTAELGKWVRRAYLLLSLIAALAGLAVVGDLISGDSSVAGVIDDQLVSATLAGYSGLLFGIMSYICFRPPGPADWTDRAGVHTYSGIKGYRSKRRWHSLLVVLLSLGFSALAVAVSYSLVGPE